MMRAENFFILRRKPVEVRAVTFEWPCPTGRIPEFKGMLDFQTVFFFFAGLWYQFSDHQLPHRANVQTQVGGFCHSLYGRDRQGNQWNEAVSQCSGSYCCRGVPQKCTLLPFLLSWLTVIQTFVLHHLKFCLFLVLSICWILSCSSETENSQLHSCFHRVCRCGASHRRAKRRQTWPDGRSWDT